MTKVALCVTLSAAQKARLETAIAPHQLVDAQHLSSSEVAFGNPSPVALAEAASLTWIQLESVGFGEYLHLDWQELGARLCVTNLAGMFADPAAETALAGILALHRAIDQLTVLQHKLIWVGDEIRAQMSLLKGSNVVLFGRGAINGRLAELLSPFKCSITSFGSDWQASELEAALEKADLVVSCVPDTPKTRNLFDANRIARMNQGAIFCNIGRGSVVDEDALAQALHSGHLSGAVIDVTQDEPLPKDHSFWSTPNTVLTQHSGGGTKDEMDRKIDWFLANFERYKRQEPLLGVVNFDKGY